LKLKDNILDWPPLISGILLKRYKRFLADILLSDGTKVTAHCPNSGSMTGCCESGRPVYISKHNNPKRKYPYTWELIDMGTSLVGVNTMRPNRLVAETVMEGNISEFNGFDKITPEIKVGKHSRLDLKLEKKDSSSCYVEIKNCTLVENSTALFPDAVTIRGQKHLTELEILVTKGHRCVMFFLIQRMDAHRFSPADHIDPAYGDKLRQAASAGVEILAYDVTIDFKKIKINQKLPTYL
jgi:sugar fermentation stimulation protein A